MSAKENIQNEESQKKDLRLKIQDIAGELQKIETGIQQAENKKIKAKEDYQSCLDQGDESGMKRSLAEIRNSNAEKEKLIASLGDFPAKIEELRTVHKELLSHARVSRDSAEKQIEEIRRKYEAEKTNYDSVHGILNNLNHLNNLLQGIKDKVNPKPDIPQTRPYDPNISGNI